MIIFLFVFVVVESKRQQLLVSQEVLDDNLNEPLRRVVDNVRRKESTSSENVDVVELTTTTPKTTIGNLRQNAKTVPKKKDRKSAAAAAAEDVVDSDVEQQLIDIVIGGDSNYWPGMFATAKSIVESASRATQRRLRIHLLADEADGDEQMRRLEMLTDCALMSGAMMRDVGVDRPVLSLIKFDSRRFPFRIGWSESKNSVLRNLTSPHNFARFYLAQYLPTSIRKIVWLDADVLVLDDIANLFDTTLVDSNTDNNDDNDDGLVFAACTTIRRFDFMIDMSPGSKILQRKPALSKCYQNNCEHFNAGVSMLRLDRWRRRNITAHIEDWIAFLNQHSDLVTTY